MLLDRGCAIDLAGINGATGPSSGGQHRIRRVLQSYLGQHLSSDAALCAWDQVRHSFLGPRDIGMTLLCPVFLLPFVTETVPLPCVPAAFRG